jgi:hypothetical protein
MIGLAACTSAATPAPVEPVSNTDTTAPPTRVGLPAGWLFVDGFTFEDGYNGRPFAISVNTAIPGHDKLLQSLAWKLDDAGVVSQVAVEPFGEDAPPFVEIHVGDLVPVAVTQAVLEVYGHEQSLAIRLGVSYADEGFGNRNRLYVGSLVHSVGDELTEDELTALLQPGHDAHSFYSQIPTVPTP